MNGQPPLDIGRLDREIDNTGGSQAELSWMTPRANKITESKSREDFTPTLMEQVQTWRTPTDDTKRGGSQDAAKRQAGGHTVNLADQVHAQGKLNPHWVACLMGYPPLWAEIGQKFIKPGTRDANKKYFRKLQTELRNSKATETPSSRRRPSRSPEQSAANSK